MRSGFIYAITILLFVLFVSPVAAHPGKLDANGGHTCRTNCEQYGLQYGEYHYPNGSSGASTQTALPVQKAQTAVNTPIPTKPVTNTPYVETTKDKKNLFKVKSVSDGDTIKVVINGKVETVRLLGIDTPETVDPRKPVQCFGKAASDKLKSVLSGKFVKLVEDSTQGNRDKYKRLLRYVYLENGTFINAEMVKQGYAFSYKEYPTKMLTKFNAYEKTAREKSLGLWGACPVNDSRSASSTSKPIQQVQKSVPAYTGGDKDCGDFATYAEAQAFFVSQGGPGSDPHRLDADKDGSACETLP